jgi:uncharacterized protein (TIGR03067 family)
MSRAWSVLVLSAAALALAGSLPSAPAPLPPRPPRDPVAAEWKRLSGTWAIKRREHGGKPEPLGTVPGADEIAFHRDTLVLPGQPPLACRLRPGDSPKRIDAQGGPTEDYPAELILRGIYKLEGDVLTFCYYAAAIPTRLAPADRDEIREALARPPAQFETARQWATLLVLKRKRE